MMTYGFTLLLLAALTTAHPGVTNAPRANAQLYRPANLTSALRASDIVEIYDLRGVQFPADARPDTVREVGCRYVLHRAGLKGDSRWWRDLERSLKQADLRLLPSSERRQVQIGLVLNDWRGTLWEIYLDDLPDRNGRVSGFEQRRSIQASASLVDALKNFVARHPELIQTPARDGQHAQCPPPALLLVDTESPG